MKSTPRTLPYYFAMCLSNLLSPSDLEWSPTFRPSTFAILPSLPAARLLTRRRYHRLSTPRCRLATNLPLPRCATTAAIFDTTTIPEPRQRRGADGRPMLLGATTAEVMCGVTPSLDPSRRSALPHRRQRRLLSIGAVALTHSGCCTA
jgi:hypothetical protein